MSKAPRSVLLALLLAALGGILALAFFDHIVPFRLDREPNLLTAYHLQVLKRYPARCIAALERSGVDYVPAPPLRRDNGCGSENAVRLWSSGVSYGSRILLQCPAMLGVLLWERHVLVPAAERHFGGRPTSVRHLGTYACRSVRLGKTDRLSQHAFANAIDVAGFRIAGGQSVSVLRDWNDKGAKGDFLREVRDGACRIFGVVLSPDSDRRHADHLHVDMSLAGGCR